MAHDPSTHLKPHLVKMSRGYSICIPKWTTLTLSGEKRKNSQLVVLSLTGSDNKEVSEEREGCYLYRQCSTGDIYRYLCVAGIA